MECKNLKVICVASHPDDIELGCGGAVAQFVEKGYEVWCIYLTKGEEGQAHGDNPKLRVKESITACGILGVDKDRIVFGNFKDTCIPETVETIHFLEQFYINDMESVYAVVIPSFKEIHQDHRATAKACITAFRYVPRIFAYESPSTAATFNPTSFIDITNFMKIKRSALKCHESQIKLNKMYMEYRAMLCLSAFRGHQIGVKYAEAFETIKFLVM
jgi:LmbE family N-acetylglucosaminyl deacetylase